MVLTTLQRLANKLLFYSPDQVRGADGRWDGGGGSNNAGGTHGRGDRGAANEGRMAHIDAITASETRVAQERDRAESATIAKAKDFARAAHDAPTFDHVQKVAATVKSFNPHDANQVAAAYLHQYNDVNPTTGSAVINKEFGPDVGKLYDEVSKSPESGPRLSSRAQDIRIADIQHTAGDLTKQNPAAAADYRVKNEAPLRGMTDGRRTLREAAIHDLYGHDRGFPGENLPTQVRRAASANRE